MEAASILKFRYRLLRQLLLKSSGKLGHGTCIHGRMMDSRQVGSQVQWSWRLRWSNLEYWVISKRGTPNTETWILNPHMRQYFVCGQVKAWNIQETPEKVWTPWLLKWGIKKQTTSSLEPSTSQTSMKFFHSANLRETHICNSSWYNNLRACFKQLVHGVGWQPTHVTGRVTCVWRHKCWWERKAFNNVDVVACNWGTQMGYS